MTCRSLNVMFKSRFKKSGKKNTDETRNVTQGKIRAIKAQDRG